MFKSKLSKVIVSLLRRVLGVTRSGAKRLMRAMLRSLMAMGRRANLPVAGFVLPTVTMVLLVVILLTIAITLRSFDRANTARNVRVNQQVLAAATPAIDRAKAKIQFMLWEDPQRPTGTPSDPELYRMMSNANALVGTPDLYSFGDEERLVLRADLDKSGTADPAADPKKPPIDSTTGVDVENEAINTAWRYPVDTNNDGKFDTFTLYGIYFRTPKRSNVSGPTLGDFTRARKSLEARTPPTSANSINPECVQGGGTVASLVGDSGWYRIDGPLKKSFFVDTVNVQITQKDIDNGLDPNKYQPFTGTASTSALEYQQDQSRIPLANNAVVYEDDLDISPGPPLNLNGRIFTNSNLLVTGLNNPNTIKLYQVSSPDSCFYEQENSKIVVGGNVVNGWSGNNTTKNAVDVHLFKKASSLTGNRNAAMLSAAKTIDTGNQSSINTSLDVLYNNEAYAARRSSLVEAQMGPPLANGEPDPNPQPSDPFSVQNKPATQTREQALEEYFKQMLRKVPFKEVPLGGDATSAGTPPFIGGSNDTLRPNVDTWSTSTPTTPISLTLNQLETTTPTEDGSPLPEELLLGDRVVAGNNLPAKRWDVSKSKFTSGPDPISGKWNSTDTSGIPRTRSPQVTKLADVGATDRDNFWEGKAAEIPKNPLDGIGGLRVITSAGVYERKNSFLPPPSWINPLTGAPVTGDTATYDDPTTTAVTEKYPVVWPDSMPMSPLGPGSKVYNNIAGNWIDWPSSLPVSSSLIDPTTPQYAKGDLRMRATAVYHYKKDGGYDPNVKPIDLENVKPFACVSSYYDPSTASTARNLSTLTGSTDVSGDTGLGTRGTQVGSNNGVVYGPPTRTLPSLSTLNTTTGLLGGGDAILEAQANLVFPDGRFANKPLRDALQKAKTDRTLAEKAAIDSTNCALQILKGELTPNPIIPHGAIKEVAFLNAREIKAIDRDDPTTIVNEAFTLSSPLTTIAPAKPANLTGNYNQPLEERQPLEIRATQIDLNVLRSNSIAGEPLLPYSGIIYASRDDALPDLSARPAASGAPGINESKSATVSPTDSRLDPTRKPNGILLVNGSKLARDPSLGSTVADVVREKGLTLVSNLPVYIKGTFNLHTQQEFKTTFDWNTFYDRQATDLNKNFACRPNDPRLNGKCTTGDDWRPANILADAITLLSDNYRFGFRNEGDFDLRNNAGAAAVLPRRQQGFFNNNFVTNGLSSGAFSTTGVIPGTGLLDTNYVTNTNALRSSYFNNFVTPVQRRGPFPEYVMEVCTKLPVYSCGDGDWFVDPLATSPRKATAAGTTYTSPNPDPAILSFQAGSTVDPPVPALQRFPRRVAFKSGTPPTPFGITGGTTIAASATPPTVSPTRNTSLWFATNSGGNVAYDATNPLYLVNGTSVGANNTTIRDGSATLLPNLAATSSLNPATPVPPTSYSGSQPLLLPVLQIQTVAAAAPSPSLPRGGAGAGTVVDATGWMPQAVNTTFNLIVGANDTPSRALPGNVVGDFNGGLQNLPRFLENWKFGGVATNIQGAFIQLNRSAYSTAPYIPILDQESTQQKTANTKLLSLFDKSLTSPPAPVNTLPDPLYRTANGSVPTGGGRLPFFTPPARNWGYDLGLLSQPPDLFTQKFTTPPSRPNPDEYFREVPRNDDWVKTLMCSTLEKDKKNATETLTTADRTQCSTL